MAAQAAYADYLAKDDSGAIAAFLDDPSTSLLQVSLAKSVGQLQVRLANAAEFPKGCFYQVRPRQMAATRTTASVQPEHFTCGWVAVDSHQPLVSIGEVVLRRQADA